MNTYSFVGLRVQVLFTYWFSIAWSDLRSVTEQWISDMRGLGMCARVCACVSVCVCAWVRVWFTTHMHVGLVNVDRSFYSIHYRFPLMSVYSSLCITLVGHFNSKLFTFFFPLKIVIQVSGIRIYLQLR